MGVKCQDKKKNFPNFFPTMSKTIITGLDIGTSAIRLIVCEEDDGGALRPLAQIKKESRGLKRGYVVNFEETVNNLKEAASEAERQAKIKVRDLILGIGGITLEAKVGEGQAAAARADLEITDADVERAVEASSNSLGEMVNRRIIHHIPISFKLDGKKIPPPGRPEGLRGQRIEVKTLFIHCFSQHLDEMLRAVKKAGLQATDFVAGPLASAAVALTPTDKTAGSVLVNIGSQTTSVVVYEDSLPVSLQVLPIGSSDVTNDIALGLRVSLEEAEKMKLETESRLTIKKKLDDIIEARLYEIFEAVEAHLKKISRAGLLPAGVVIVGGGARTENIERLAEDILKLPIRVFDPGADNRFRNQIRDAGWTVSYGLCLSAVNREEDGLAGWSARKGGQTIFRWLKELWP